MAPSDSLRRADTIGGFLREVVGTFFSGGRTAASSLAGSVENSTITRRDGEGEADEEAAAGNMQM